MGAGPALRPPPSSRLREVPAVAPGFASTLGGQCQLFGHFRGERKSLRGCARPASAVSHRSAPRHAAPPGCAPGAEAGPSRPASQRAARPCSHPAVRCRRHALPRGWQRWHSPAFGGWVARDSAAVAGREHTASGKTRRAHGQSGQPHGGHAAAPSATQPPSSGRCHPAPILQTGNRGPETGGREPARSGHQHPCRAAGQGLPRAPRCPVRPRPCPVAPPAALPHRGPGPRGPRRSQAPAPPTAAGRGQGGAFTSGTAPHSPPPRCPAPPSLPLGLLPPTAQTGPLSNGEPLSRWFSSDGAHRPGPRFGGIRGSWCLPHARPASSRVLLPRPQGS